MANHEETATLGGCLWCLDAPFRELRGVIRVESGYAGGRVPAPIVAEIAPLERIAPSGVRE